MNVAVCPGMAARLAAQGVPRERLTVIPNWADGELIRPLAPQDNPLRAAWGLGERFVVGYSGNLGCAHAGRPRGRADHLAGGRAEARLPVHRRRLRLSDPARRDRRTPPRATSSSGPIRTAPSCRSSLTAPDLHLVTLRPELRGPGHAEQTVRRARGRPPDRVHRRPRGRRRAHRPGRPGPGRAPRTRCRRSPRRSGRCAAIRRASRGWAPPPGAPTTPSTKETPASTPGPAACAPPPWPAAARPLPQPVAAE